MELLVIVVLQAGETSLFTIAAVEDASGLVEEFFEIMPLGQSGRIPSSTGEGIEKEHVGEGRFAASVKTCAAADA